MHYTTQHYSALVANISSLTLDYIARQKVGGTNLNFFYVQQFPFLAPNQYSEADLNYISKRVLELSFTSHSMRPFAEDLGYYGSPFTFDPDRRLHLRAELDALFGKKYGLTREELCYVLDPQALKGADYPSETFRGLKNKELQQYGEYRTQRLVLEAFDKMTGN